MKILHDSGQRCYSCLYDLGYEYFFPIAVETRCSCRANQLDGKNWRRRFIVSSQRLRTLYLPLTASQVLLAVQLGAFIREFISPLHLDKCYIYCDVLGVQAAPFPV